MKTIKLILLVFATMLFAENAAAQSQKTVQTATIKTSIYCEHCKHCETCGPKFDKVLLREKGVQMVVLDEEANTVKVTYNSKKTDLQKIKVAISKLGYDADEVKADVLAYNGLDECCKKS